MAYTTINKSSDYFNTKLYTGTGAEHAITGVGFQPDFVWTKRRDTTSDNHVHDAIRGATYKLQTNDAGVNNTDAQTLKSFDSDGFTLGTNTSSNASSGTFVSWNFLANGSGSSNSDGSITATVSASSTSGFSMIKYTGSGSASTVGHGLGAAPDLTIRKKLNTSDNWYIHTTLIDGSFDFLKLNSTDAKSDSSLTGFTSTTIGVDASSYEEIIYAFKSIKGFSKFGKYVGNGNADGPMIYTGFKPAWYMYKRTDSADSWSLVDSKRIGYNPDNNRLFPNSTAAEDTQDRVDLVSNGIKIRTSDTGTNDSSGTYIYMAFAEAPLVGSNNIPCTAR